MIVLDTSPPLFITQPDHAGVSRAIIERWRTDGFPDVGRRGDILLAAEKHDDGWLAVDADPLLDPSGQVLDFVHVPADVRHGLWRRGVEGLAATPYAAALVAQHALHVYRRSQGDAAWIAFFDEMQAFRDRYVAAAAAALDEVLADYRFLRLADLASLAFCGVDVAAEAAENGCEMRLDGTCLTIAPDPFEGETFPIAVPAREMGGIEFASAAAARAAWTSAPVVVRRGTAIGAP